MLEFLKPTKKIMRNFIILFALITSNTFFGQTTIIPNQDSRVITTGVPFLLIASDARAAALGDMVSPHLLMPIHNNGIHQNMHFLRQNLE